jgi:peptide deformylase
MAVLPIRLYGDSVLREKTRPIKSVDDELRQLAADMGETMYAANGIGLAAPQVGDTRRMLVYDVAQVIGDKRKNGKRMRDPGARHLEVVLNAEVIDSSVEDERSEEGCLSIPGLEAPVYRSIKIKMRFMTLDGEWREESYSGLTARVLQHEIDHLDGILFVDRLPASLRADATPHLAKVRRGEVPSALELGDD